MSFYPSLVSKLQNSPLSTVPQKSQRKQAQFGEKQHVSLTLGPKRRKGRSQRKAAHANLSSNGSPLPISRKYSSRRRLSALRASRHASYPTPVSLYRRTLTINARYSAFVSHGRISLSPTRQSLEFEINNLGIGISIMDYFLDSCVPSDDEEEGPGPSSGDLNDVQEQAMIELEHISTTGWNNAASDVTFPQSDERSTVLALVG